MLLVSIDPERDTPAALRKLADERRIDTSRWTLAHADAAAVRRIAAALSIQYRKLPNGEFSHSTIISALAGRTEKSWRRARSWATLIPGC